MIILYCNSFHVLVHYGLFTRFVHLIPSDLHRLVEIAENRFPDVYSTADDLEHLAANVFIHIESTCSSLMKRWATTVYELVIHILKSSLYYNSVRN